MQLLSCWVERQVLHINNLVVLRPLVPRQPRVVLAEFIKILFRNLRILQGDIGYNLFAPCLARRACHKDIDDAWMVLQGILDDDGMDIFCAGDDHVIHQTTDGDVSVLIPCGCITGQLQPSLYSTSPWLRPQAD